MLLVGCYLWSDESWKHSGEFRYGPQHVRLLKDAVRKHLTVPHEFVVITDQPDAFAGDSDIRAVPLDLSAHVPGKEWVKLMTFHPEGWKLFGGVRMLQLDLDAIVCGSLDAIVDRTEPLVVWRNPARIPWENPAKFQGRAYYNGSIILHTLGTGSAIWDLFVQDKEEIVSKLRDTQAWMSALIGWTAPYWDAKDGIYRLERDDTPGSGIRGALPDNAKLVFFPGSAHKPWLPEVRAANPWIAQYWPEAA